MCFSSTFGSFTKRNEDPDTDETCMDCGEALEEGDSNYFETGDGPYCEDCYGNNFTSCELCDREIYREHGYYVDETTWLCAECFNDEHCFECCVCGCFYHPASIIKVKQLFGLENTICLYCADIELYGFEKYAYRCSHCLDYYFTQNINAYALNGYRFIITNITKDLGGNTKYIKYCCCATCKNGYNEVLQSKITCDKIDCINLCEPSAFIQYYYFNRTYILCNYINNVTNKNPTNITYYSVIDPTGTIINE